MKRICSKCFREFTEEDSRPIPIETLGQIYIEGVDNQDARDVCPICREELGILNLLGFGE